MRAKKTMACNMSPNLLGAPPATTVFIFNKGSPRVSFVKRYTSGLETTINRSAAKTGICSFGESMVEEWLRTGDISKDFNSRFCFKLSSPQDRAHDTTCYSTVCGCRDLVMTRHQTEHDAPYSRGDDGDGNEIFILH